jgi:RNA-directed DNA polymerase
MISGIDLKLFSLQTAHSVKDVASALELDSGKLFYVLQHTDDGLYYQTFQIPKKNGGLRTIAKPVKGLALAQDRFAPVLHHVYNPGQYVKGFVKGSSFLDNAKYHDGQRWVLNIDIENFFPSITFARVRGLFLSNLFGFNDRVATILARICTFNGCLPQGASTSPVLANIIAKSLDKKLFEIAREGKLKYSRYSDDITFSSSKSNQPKDLVKSFNDYENERVVILGDRLKDAIRSSGFALNSSKTRLMLRDDRQEVTGLVVNHKANIRRQDIARLRMKIFSAQGHGLEESGKLWLNGNGDAFVQHIVGWLAFVRQVRGPSDPVLAKLCLQAHQAGITKIKWIEELADMTKEFDVFLSHASEDKDNVRKLADALTAKGVTVFLDESSIKWGDSIVEKVNHGLLKSRFFLPYLTSTFSKKGWPNKELNSAIQTNISRKNRILPIRENSFDIDTRYPLLNDILYKTWPSDPAEETSFVANVVDEILALIELERQTG